MLKYTSTRNDLIKIDAKEAILKGLSADGGLFVPETIPFIDIIYDLKDYDYKQLATYLIKLFFEDYDIEDFIKKAYGSNFDDQKIVPLKKINDLYFLELFHGPTSAFKDLALQFLPHLMSNCLKDNKISIISATSGDTGKAALEGFKNIDNINITILYPYEKVSKIQELQMITSSGNNVDVIGVKGNFDDCQKLVKKILKDNDNITSANSINIARLIPQIVYYFKAYYELINKKEINTNELIDFIVPTGNFGDILAGYFAKKMGLPIDKLICASNINNVLTDFINTGIYNSKRELIKTSSPSIDILVSSNLERLLYLKTKDSNYINTLMNDLSTNNYFKINGQLLKDIQNDFLAFYSDENEIRDNLKKIYNDCHYLIDTHTAVGLSASQKYKTNNKKVILSTASPFKFSKDVYYYLTNEIIEDDFKAMEYLSNYTNQEIPNNLKILSHLQPRFSKIIEKDDIDYLKNKMRSYNV